MSGESWLAYKEFFNPPYLILQASSVIVVSVDLFLYQYTCIGPVK